MRRVAVFGNAGGGKSTLARQLASITRLPLHSLDTIKYGRYIVLTKTPGGVITYRSSGIVFLKNYLLKLMRTRLEYFGGSSRNCAELKRDDAMGIALCFLSGMK
jgi:adenylate kinase family enzyme